MRKLLLLAPALLAACAMAPGPSVAPGQASGRTCVAANTDRFIGQPGTSETGAAILQATHASVMRWAPPGTMLTMDYRFDRVTVRLGPDHKVTAVNCG
jgi:hypothetical protein